MNSCSSHRGVSPTTRPSVRRFFPGTARWLALLSACLMAGNSVSEASLLARESFNYTANSALTGMTGPQGFSSPYTAVNSGLLVSADGASYGDLTVAGNKLAFAGTTNGNFGVLTNSPETPGTSVYMSYLIKVDPAADYAGVSLFDGANEVLFTGKRTGAANVLGLDPRTGTAQNSTAYCTRLSLVVCRIDFSAASAVIRMYVNPQSGTEPATADATVTRTVALTYDRVRFQSNASTGFVDEFRLGNTFADVVPMTYGGNPSEIVVLGSSVAYGVGAATQNDAWAYRLKSLLETPPPVVPDSRVIWNVHNASVGGNNTTAVLNRFQNDVATPRAGADIVVIGLSLANEGLVGSTNPQPVFDSFKNGLAEIIRRCRVEGFYPVVALCYPQNLYNAQQYAYVRKMNLLLNTWDTPCINLLGAIDEGNGHWATGYSADDGHPNSQGHLELYSSVVPSLFEAIITGKTTTPGWARTTGYLRLQQDAAARSPLVYTPAQDYRSFTLSLRMRSTGTGTVGTIGTGAGGATLEVRANSLVYVSPAGVETAIPTTVNDGAWHDLAVAHRKATNKTLVFVDGQLKASVDGTITTPSFIVGGPGNIAGRAAAPLVADYQDVAIYRAAWTEDEALAQSNGALQQASLDILATLDDAAPIQGAKLANRAQSMSALTLQTSGFTTGTAMTTPDGLSAASYAAGTASLIWTDHTNGAATYTIQRRRTDISGAWAAVGTAPGNKPSFEDSGLVQTSAYAYRVLIASSGLQEDYSNVAFVTPSGQGSLSYQNWINGYYPPLLEGGIYQVDFNTSVSPDYGGQIWNTVSNPGITTPLALRDTANQLSGVTVSITNAFDQNRNDNGAPLADYPAAAQVSQFAVRDDNPVTGAITFGGLDTAAKYDFTFFARRGTLVDGFDYNGNYTFTGGGSPVSVVVNAANNTALTPVPGIAPNASGAITLTVSAVATTGSRFPCINFIKFRKSVPGTHLIDFNTNAAPVYGAVRWNTVNSLTSSTPYQLRDIYNTLSGSTLTLTDGFDQFRSDNIAPVPDLAAAAQNSQFCLRLDNPLTASMTFSGLDPAKSYDFSFLSKRGSLVAGFDYTGTFTFTGAGTPVVVITDAAVNNALTPVPPLVPDTTGKITLGIGAGNGNGERFPVLNLIRFSPAAPSTYDPRREPGADPDGDGLTNFEEYARGFDPTVADGKPFRIDSFKQDTSTGSRFELVLDRRATDARCVLQSSDNLSIWNPETSATRSTLRSSGSLVTLLYEVPPSGSRRFFRFSLDAPALP